MPDSPVHILYIDDDPGLVRFVEKACQRRGYRITPARTVRDGLAKLAAEPFSVVVLDHHLDGETGLDFLKARGASETKVPVIYVTGSTDAAVAVGALKAGAAEYVVKSAAGDFLELLFNAVEAALARDALERAKLRAEQEVRDARDRAELMLHEINHRIANSLAMVASLVRMQTSMISEPGAVAALKETQARIKAVSGVHRRLYKSTDMRQVALDEYMRDLVEDIRTSMQADGLTSRIELRADPITISTDKTVAIGVAVTELVTNAIKYAYPAGESGSIRVYATALGAGRTAISVEDDGIGWNGVGDPQGSGLGTRIVAAMMTSLSSCLTYETPQRGTRVRFVFEQ